MRLQRINTIAELQAEQDRLKAKMRVARNEFHKSAGRTTAGSREYLLKNILLPAGAIGLGVLVAKKLAGHHDADETAQNGRAAYQAPPHIVEQEKPVAHWFSKLMLVALPLVQQFLLSVKNKEEARQDEANEHPGHAATRPNTAINWMATIIPIAIPLLQQYFVKKEEAAEEHVITFDDNGDEVATTSPQEREGASAIFESLFRMLPVVLPLVQQFLTAQKQPDDPTPGNLRYAKAMA